MVSCGESTGNGWPLSLGLGSAGQGISVALTQAFSFGIGLLRMLNKISSSFSMVGPERAIFQDGDYIFVGIRDRREKCGHRGLGPVNI
jgi:hypothetical protein